MTKANTLLFNITYEDSGPLIKGELIYQHGTELT